MNYIVVKPRLGKLLECTMNCEKEIELPEWLDPQIWSDYLDLRKILKKPMTKKG